MEAPANTRYRQTMPARCKATIREHSCPILAPSRDGIRSPPEAVMPQWNRARYKFQHACTVRYVTFGDFIDVASSTAVASFISLPTASPLRHFQGPIFSHISTAVIRVQSVVLFVDASLSVCQSFRNWHCDSLPVDAFQCRHGGPVTLFPDAGCFLAL